MKRRSPRLVINVETLRVLDGLELRRIAAGDDAIPRDTRPAICGVPQAAPKP